MSLIKCERCGKKVTHPSHECVLPMSDTFKCTECGGSGYIVPDPLLSPKFLDNRKPCPTCKETGNMVLAVAVPAKHEGDTGYYRPLTSDEVEELVKGYQSESNHLNIDETVTPDKIVDWLKEGDDISYDFQPVKLIPGDK